MEATRQDIHRDLIDRCKAGNRSAQYELYKLYNRAMYNTCFRFVNNREEAEDILQESFLSAFNKINSFRADASFGSWLKRIVVNNAINYLRKRKFDLQELNDSHEYIGENLDDSLLEKELNVKNIKNSIQLLPDGFRTVLSLYLLEGYDHKEIGEVLGISESTSKSQYMRAKIKLKAMLETI